MWPTDISYIMSFVSAPEYMYHHCRALNVVCKFSSLLSCPYPGIVFHVYVCPSLCVCVCVCVAGQLVRNTGELYVPHLASWFHSNLFIHLVI